MSTDLLEVTNCFGMIGLALGSLKRDGDSLLNNAIDLVTGNAVW